jgi:hypothetical protein
VEAGFFGIFDEARFLLLPLSLADGRARLELEDLFLVRLTRRTSPAMSIMRSRNPIFSLTDFEATFSRSLVSWYFSVASPFPH